MVDGIARTMPIRSDENPKKIAERNSRSYFQGKYLRTP